VPTNRKKKARHHYFWPISTGNANGGFLERSLTVPIGMLDTLTLMTGGDGVPHNLMTPRVSMLPIWMAPRVSMLPIWMAPRVSMLPIWMAPRVSMPPIWMAPRVSMPSPTSSGFLAPERPEFSINNRFWLRGGS